ncbi:MAG: hypothetical protein LBD23_09380, partial [Oscillospiraceae bacterium]|nr:hypothetical protein [Oscillospiraceae bacterium]
MNEAIIIRKVIIGAARRNWRKRHVIGSVSFAAKCIGILSWSVLCVFMIICYSQLNIIQKYPSIT